MVTQNWQLQKATDADIAELVQLINSAYRGDSSRQGWTTEADILSGIRTDIETLRTELTAPGAQMLKATNEKGVIDGCVFLQQQQLQLYLGMLTVAPHLQNKGLGKRLLQAAESVAKDLSCTHIAMTVISLRHELIDWYKRHGYRPTGENRPFIVGEHIGVPSQPLSFIVLKKNI